jgi:BirA family biotin operon repressor/biotin-[acetyl-CoA-carboxylase] ligase
MPPTHLPFLLGLACRDGLSSWTDEVRLKWVNDMVARRRKLGGLLVELTRHGAVAGIGINLVTQPVEGAIGLAELGVTVSPEAVAERVLAEIQAWWTRYRAEGFDAVDAGWSRSSVTLGQAIRVVDVEPTVTGTAERLGPSGELLVRATDGTLQTVISGTIRTLDGAYC